MVTVDVFIYRLKMSQTSSQRLTSGERRKGKEHWEEMRPEEPLKLYKNQSVRGEICEGLLG